jgi:hypothetical protein
MRAAKPSELTEHAVPVLAATMTESELSDWIPVKFADINDPEATAEPSKGALIKLAAGPYVVLFYGKASSRLVLEFPASDNATANLRSFLDEVPIPSSRITWHRPDIQFPLKPQTKRAQPVSSAPRTANRVARSSQSGVFRTVHSDSKTTQTSAARTSKKR